MLKMMVRMEAVICWIWLAVGLGLVGVWVVPVIGLDLELEDVGRFIDGR